MTARDTEPDATENAEASGNAFPLAARAIDHIKPEGKPRARFGYRRDLFLEAFALNGGSLLAACRAIKIKEHEVYDWKRRDPVFAKALEYIKSGRAADVLEDAATQRALHGWDEPVFFKGEVVGYKRMYDTKLMIVLLEMRGRYTPKTKHEISGPNGGPISVIADKFAALTDEQLADIAAGEEDGVIDAEPVELDDSDAPTE